MNQKRLGLFGFLAVLLAVSIAIWAAFDQGEKSPIYASGRVYLDPTLEEDAKALPTLFLILRDAQSDLPLPFGAFRAKLATPATATPSGFYSFVLTPDNLQTMPGFSSKTPESFSIKARLDQDGLGGPDQAGDLVGTIAEFKAGSEHLDLNIQTKVR